MTVKKLKEKAAWQLYAGASDVEPQLQRQVSSHIEEYNKALKYADEDEIDLIKIEDYIPADLLPIYMESREYQYITVEDGVHACGHLVFDGDIRREIGLITAKSESTGERTLCAAVEGQYLDEFGYVKEDFLIVDSVALTYKLFESIGEPVPSFIELKKMVDGDKPTWGIYEKGITCCVNQCEKESTTNKVKRYKPKNIGELSSFIAAIRPGFASLLNQFLHREPYTTGEAKIDVLLEDTAHYLLYQESIMKVLSFLGLPMAETYKVIKSISKKKLKGKMKDDLMKKLKANWQKEFGNLENFNKVWKVIEDAAQYSFNAPHAYSMAGDSLYLAWFKAHHPAKFYEVAITHYQGKKNKGKIDSLIKEAIKFYGYKYGTYRFGNDNRKVNVNEEEKVIYPNLSSIKGFGEKVAEELWEISQANPDSFYAVEEAVKSSSINKTLMENLIKINYFEQFGSVKKLLLYHQVFTKFYGRKSVKLDALVKDGYDIELFRRYGNTTEKMISKFNSYAFLEDYFKTIPESKVSSWDEMRWEMEVTGIINCTNPSIPKGLYFVENVELKPKVVYLTLYDPRMGESGSLKLWRSGYEESPFDKYTVLNVQKLKKTAKREPTGEINPVTGKKVYAPVPGKYELWLDRYSVYEERE